MAKTLEFIIPLRLSKSTAWPCLGLLFRYQVWVWMSDPIWSARGQPCVPRGGKGVPQHWFLLSYQWHVHCQGCFSTFFFLPLLWGKPCQAVFSPFFNAFLGLVVAGGNQQCLGPHHPNSGQVLLPSHSLNWKGSVFSNLMIILKAGIQRKEGWPWELSL